MTQFATPLSRRQWLRLAAAGVGAGCASGWLRALAADAADHPQRKRACILLWMSGGPSQLDTFDPKPGHKNGGPFKPIATRVPGIQISEHLPKIAQYMDHMAVIRSLTSKEGDHGRATFLLRTGYLPQGPVQYPSLGALVSRELGEDRSELPNFVSIAPYRIFNMDAFGSGFLGPRYAPLIVGERTGLAKPEEQNTVDRALRVEDLAPAAAISRARMDARLDLLRQVQQDFVAGHPDLPAVSHQSAYDRAARLMRTAAAKAFDLEEEKAAVRDAYGRNLFGQGCLLARRLVERGVPFVEVTLNDDGNGVYGWDTHGDNFNKVQKLSAVLDPAWAALMDDLKQRGLLDTTLIVWMGEFGRTPEINRSTGRDHWPNSFSAVLAGGGIKGGQAIGDTGPDGAAIKDHPVAVPELLATICQALGIDHQKQNRSNIGRPIRIVAPRTEAIQEVLL
jgi:uncharacterized protein (DUF1501 family)